MKFNIQKIEGDNERTEIRVSLGCNILIKVYKEANVLDWTKHYNDKELRDYYYKNNHNKIQISMNSTSEMSESEFIELFNFIQNILNNN